MEKIEKIFDDFYNQQIKGKVYLDVTFGIFKKASLEQINQIEQEKIKLIKENKELKKKLNEKSEKEEGDN